MKSMRLFCAMCVGIVLSSGSQVSATPLDEMISPVTHAVIFEDPRHSTELRPLYVHHEIDEKFVTEGGTVNVYALEARFKVSDDLSIIATKDGYVDFNPDAVLPKDEGFANITAGAKYSFFRNENSIVTAGLTYEIPVGEKEVLQGEGDGLFNPFLSAGYTHNGWNFLGAAGFRLPIDDSDSTFFDLNLHASYKIGSFYPLVEFGYITVIDGGDRLGIADEGQDFFNLGASEADNETIPTMAIGARYRITDAIDVGAAWQFPLSDGTGTRIIDNRISADLIFRFDC